MQSRYKRQICRVHCNAKETRGKAKGTKGRVIEYNPDAFMLAGRITDARHHMGTQNHVPPIDSRYPIPIPYELCTLTKYHE